MSGLAHQLLAATALCSATVVIHLVGLDVLLSVTDVHLRRFKTAWLNLDRTIVPLGIVLGLFVLHGVEIWLYALVYRLLGVLPDLEQALYYSISAYSTVGEGGAMLPPQWRVVGALEAINGMLLIGWSTAFLFQALSHLLEADEGGRLPRGAIARRRRR